MVTTDAMSDIELARNVLRIEAEAILGLVDRLGDPFQAAVRLLFDCRGRVVLTGMGKSGIICRKIAATLSSTGTPSFFLHPAEAIHGDLGVLQAERRARGAVLQRRNRGTAPPARDGQARRREADCHDRVRPLDARRRPPTWCSTAG